MDFANSVRRIHEDPRVTRPYTVAQWERIDALGHAVDARLVAGDVRLTMGGEPTYVSADDMEAPEWTVAADGPDKRTPRLRAGPPAARTGGRQTGLEHRGQGKWYPGRAVAPLADRPPVARRRHARSGRTRRCSTTRGRPGSAKPAQAGELAAAIVGALGAPASCCLPAYEDTLARLLDEARLPTGEPAAGDVDAADQRMRGAERPARPSSSSSTTQRASRPAGCCRCTGSRTAPGWATTRWRFRRGRLVLLPGDSPLGLRLPLQLRRVGAAAGRRRALGVRDAACPARGDGACCRAPRTVEVPVEDAPTTALASRSGTGTSSCSCRRWSDSRTPSSCSPQSSSRRPTSRCPGRPRGLPAARRPATALTRGHARPRRHRGQRAAVRRAGRSWSTSWPRSTRTRGWSGLAPRRSPSTAATPAPAAATT